LTLRLQPRWSERLTIPGKAALGSTRSRIQLLAEWFHLIVGGEAWRFASPESPPFLCGFALEMDSSTQM
jgi:hypothetical protein